MAKTLHPMVTDELKDITAITDERLEEIDNWATEEAREWRTLIETISTERTRRKRAVCEHDLYADVDVTKTECYYGHELWWRESGDESYWLERCGADEENKCISTVERHDEPKSYFISRCRKCDYKEAGIEKVDRNKQVL